MFQRLLSVFLCTCMVVGSVPNTAYAAATNVGRQTETVAEVAVEDKEESGATITTVEAGNVPEETGTTGEAVAETERETEETETSVETEEETGETETSVETEEETGETEESGGTEEETGEAETSEETEEETGETETSVETEEETETTVEPEETEESTEMEVESEVIETVEETTEPEETMEEPEVDQATTEDTVLALGTQQVSVSSTSWLAFTAPETGNYCINVKTDKVLSVELFRSGKSLRVDKIWLSSGSSHNFVMPREKGDMIYVRVTWAESTAANLTVTVSEVEEATVTKPGDGVYKLICNDYTVDVTLDVGCRSMQAEVALSANSGATLASGYKLEYRLGSDQTYQKINLTSTSSYKSTIRKYYLDMNTTYDLEMNLLDSEGNILAVLGSPYYYSWYNCTEFKTGQTDEKIVLNIGESTYKTVEVEYEQIEIDTMYCYYAPLTNPEKVNSIGLGVGKNTKLLTNLKANTEYRLWVEYADGTLVCEKRFTTKPLEMDVSYTMTTPTPGSIKIEASISGYEGDANSLTMWTSCMDGLGKVQREHVVKEVSEGTDGKKSCVITITIDGLVANTTYPVTVWIQEDSVYDSRVLHYAEETKEVTTPAGAIAAENVTLAVSANATTATAINYSVKIAGNNQVVSGSLYYRTKGSVGWGNNVSVRLSSSQTTASGTITALTKGMEYEFMLVIDSLGVCIGESCQAGGTVYTPQLSDKTSAYASVLTYQLQTTEVLTSATWKVAAYYKIDDDVYYSTLTPEKIELTAANGYKAEVNTADISGMKFVPDTDYSIKWELYKDGTICHTALQEIHTAVPAVTAEANYVTANTAEYVVSFPINTGDTTSSTWTLYPYLKEEGGYWRKETTSLELSVTSSGASGTIAFKGLKANTKYDVSFKDGNGETEYGSFSFTTLVDDRKLTVGVVVPDLHSVQFPVEISGDSAENTNYLHFYYREKGCESWEHLVKNKIGTGTVTYAVEEYNGSELKENTTYEYQVGIGYDILTSQENLHGIIAGEFKTSYDERKISYVQCSAGYQSMSLSTAYEGNIYKEATLLRIYYKEKEAAEWTYLTYLSCSAEYADITKVIKPLEQGTEYEYAVLLMDFGSNYHPTSTKIKPEWKVIGSITTKDSAYVLDVKKNENKSTHNQLVLDIQAKESTEDEKIYVTLYFDNGMTKEVTLYRGNQYKDTITLSGLASETEYVLTKTEISVTERNNEILIDTQTPNTSFMTDKLIIPESLTLSQEQMALNVAGNGEGISYQQLKVEASPENATTDVVWSSSNPSVATVSVDGTVQAVGAGEATITVQSLYDASVKAECEVTVKSYVVAKTESTGLKEITDTQTIYKGDTVSGLKLCEKDQNGTLTALTDYNVTSVRTGITAWTEGKLKATAVGTTEVIFEKDGVKAVIKVQVSAKAKGFGIVGLTAGNAEYPAILTEDGSYEIACVTGCTYTAQGQISPKADFAAEEFNWASSDTAVVKVVNGVITPVKSGEATITVTPKGETSPYVQEAVEFKVIVKELPLKEEPVIYALTNVKKNMKLKDVAFPESWGEGWEWKVPETVLYSLPVNKDAYSFEAVYTGTDKYALENTVKVYIGTITGISVTETSENVHNQVVQVSQSDSAKKDEIRLKLEPEYMGQISDEIQVEIPAVNGLEISRDAEEDCYVITASPKGNYVLKPQIRLVTGKDKNGNDIVTTVKTINYKIKAVEETQAASITFSSDTEGVEINQETGTITLDLTSELKNKKINLNATVKDKEGNEIQTALEWKVKDTSIATVKYAKNSSHQAQITAKGDGGYTILTAKAKDATGYTAQLILDVRDHSPRLSANKATVNLSFDYDRADGESLADAAGGSIEIAEVYGESVQWIKLYKEDKVTLETRVGTTRIIGYENRTKCRFVPMVTDATKVGKYKCQLAVKTTASEEPYFYPITITVVDKVPAVKVKMAEKMNLFYSDEKGSIVVSGIDSDIEDIIWEDNSTGANNGFTVMSRVSSTNYNTGEQFIDVTQSNVEVVNGKVKDSSVAKGTLKLKFEGLNEIIEVKNFKIAYTYKKPNLITVNSTTSVAPKIGITESYFKIYDKVSKSYLANGGAENCITYKEISCESTDVEVRAPGEWVYSVYNGNGNKKKETITMTLFAENWREPINVKHTIKIVEPKAYLYNTTLVYNKAYGSEVTALVVLKDISYLAKLSDIVIKGADTKSQTLLDKDIFEIVQGDKDENESAILKIKLNQTELMQENVKAGIYTYNLTPYYTNAETGERTALNTLKLKLKVVDKPVSVKITTKGTLDLAKNITDVYSNGVCLKTQFANLGDGCKITGAKLKGEYSKYFTLTREQYNNEDNTNYIGNYYYLGIAEQGKLKAGQNYNLAVEYTIRTGTGEEFTVEGKFKVKPKQTAPKVTVSFTNRTFYVTSLFERYCGVTLPEGYTIESVYGSIDCNKDGNPDIVAEEAWARKNYATVSVNITDPTAISATTKGKTYSIPVTIKVKGRDGISKDTKITIKIIVKK